MTRRTPALPLVFVAVLASHVAAQQAACAQRADELRRVIREVADKEHNVGLSVSIGASGRIVYSEGFGFADLEDSVPVTRRTRFTVASITKSFTGVALLLAAGRGTIDLDAPIQRYVPAFPEKPGAPITPRMLAAHLAGIRHWRNERTPELYARHFDNIEDILTLFANDSLVAPPGTAYNYSSYGYDLLGAALQRATGKAYQRVIADDLLGPLGLHDTRFDDVREVIPHRARHYTFYDLTTFADLTQPMRVPDWDYSHNMAAGDILTTADDMVRFGDALTRPGLLTPSLLGLLYTRPRVGAIASTVSFGFFVDSIAGGRRRIHNTGSNAGVQAGLYVYPDQRLVIAVISNTWGIGSRSGELVSGGPSDLPTRLAAICLR